MEFLEVEGSYQNGQVVLNETPKDITSSRVIVRFLEEAEAQSSKDAEREAAVQRLFALLKEPVDLGGGPYYKERGEIYEED